MLFFRHRYAQRAADQIRAGRPLVIAVAGRIGKTTTAACIAHLLSQTLPSLIVSGSREMIEHAIAERLQPTHRVLIVECQQQSLNEMRALCELTQPIIGVVTNMSESEHREPIAHLLASLPSSGLAILNHDDPQCQQLAQHTPAAVRFFSTRNHAHVFAQSVLARPQEVRFELHLRESHQPLSVRLHGQHLLPSLLAASAVAEACGLAPLQMKERMEAMSILPYGIQMRHGKNHAVLLLCAPSIYPEATIAGLEYLRLFQAKRRILLLTRRVSESAYSQHEMALLGKRAAESADSVLMTGQSKKFRDAFLTGVRSMSQHKVAHIIHAHPQSLLRSHLSLITPYDIVLVDGVPNKRLMRQLLQT